MEVMNLEPQKKKPDVRNLEVMSIEALEEYIGELHAEIERIRAEIAKKQSARGAAEAVFRE